MLTKEQILSADDAKFEDVEVPEWGGTVRVATMSGYARDRFEASIVNRGGTPNIDNVRAKLVAASVVDAKGNLLFNENDIIALGKKNCKALDKIFEVSQRLNGIGQSQVEDMAKNS